MPHWSILFICAISYLNILVALWMKRRSFRGLEVRLTKAQRNAVYRDAQAGVLKLAFRGRFNSAITVTLILLFLAGIAQPRLQFANPLGLFFLPWVLLVMIAHWWSLQIQEVFNVRWEVRRIGYEVCVSCGYWLRGLGNDVDRCPECGADREPFDPEDRCRGLSMPRPSRFRRMDMWCGVAVGVCVLLLVLPLERPSLPIFLLVFGLGLVAGIVLLIVRIQKK